MKPLVIGGTGFIGYNIVKALTEKGYDVRCTRRKSSNTLFLRKLKPQLANACLDDPASLRSAMKDRDVVFMAAAHYPRYSLRMDQETAIAAQRTANVVQAAKECGVGRFIFTSSAATADWRIPRNIVATEDHVASSPPPRSVYHAVKFVSEKIVRDAIEDGFPGVVLCPSGCIGEFDAKAGTGFLMVALARGLLKFSLKGMTNLVDVSSIAAAHIEAAERPEALGKRFLLGGHNINMNELIGRICDKHNLQKPKRRLPLGLAAVLTTLDEKRCSKTKGRRPIMAREFVDILRHGRYISQDKAVRELSLHVPPLDETLDKAWSWFARHGYLGTEYKMKIKKQHGAHG